MANPRWPLSLSSVLLTAVLLPGQTINQLRDQVREGLNTARHTAFIAGMVDLTENSELSAGSIRIDGSPDLRITTYKLPVQRDFSLGEGCPQLHVEAGLGYIIAKATVPDIWSGSDPSIETEVNTRWTGVSGFLGAGPRFDLGSGLHLTPLVDISLAYVENHARYEGPGSTFTAAVFDGLFLNWHATDYAYGGALRLEHEHDLGDRLHHATLVRYDLRQFDVIRSTDAAQDARDALQRLVVRSELQGPTGMTIGGKELTRRAHAAYTRFLNREGETLGFTDYFEIGGGLAGPLLADKLPVHGCALSGAFLYGEDLIGWSFGFALTF